MSKSYNLPELMPEYYVAFTTADGEKHLEGPYFQSGMADRRVVLTMNRLDVILGSVEIVEYESGQRRRLSDAPYREAVKLGLGAVARPGGGHHVKSEQARNPRVYKVHAAMPESHL
jgi:hypothetical protein